MKTVAELIALLQKMPQDAEALIDRGGAYGEVKSVQAYAALKTSLKDYPSRVFISDEEE